MSGANEELINHRLSVLERDVKDLTANIYDLTSSVKLLAAGMAHVKWAGMAAAASVIAHVANTLLTVS